MNFSRFCPYIFLYLPLKFLSSYFPRLTFTVVGDSEQNLRPTSTKIIFSPATLSQERFSVPEGGAVVQVNLFASAFAFGFYSFSVLQMINRSINLGSSFVETSPATQIKHKNMIFLEGKASS